MTLVARHAVLTDVGLLRSGNEDAYAAEPPLFAVADGMGGAKAGEVASALALETLAARLAAGDGLVAAAAAANAAVFERASADPGQSGMGTTLTALRLTDTSAEAVQVGDSRLYRLRDGALQQLTEDHSVVGEWLRAGAISADEAHASKYRNVLTRALGTEPAVEIDDLTLEVRAGDLLLLCSDGLSSMLTDDEIAAVLVAQTPDVEACARRLVHEAKNHGGHDNITVIIVAIDEVEPGAGEPEDEGAGAAAAGPAEEAGAITEDIPLPAGGAAAAPEEDEGKAGDAAEAAGPTGDTGPGTGDGVEAGATLDEHDAKDDGATATGRRRRTIMIVALVAVALVLVGLVAGILVVDNMYFVGVDQGMVSVYRGAPYEVGGVKLYRVYLRSTVPIGNVRADLQQRVLERHVTSKDDALRLVREVQGISP